MALRFDRGACGVVGVWLVFIGICQIVWAVITRKNMDSSDRALERLLTPSDN
ncbi:MAG: hypothetical protein ACLP3C_31115 [Mycobacterium sp.]|uniref:hypothetical protein n=1 Tax=Mycobacterium sp. TaxID=1785 RepID=UPI003F9B6939